MEEDKEILKVWDVESSHNYENNLNVVQVCVYFVCTCLFLYVHTVFVYLCLLICEFVIYVFVYLFIPLVVCLFICMFVYFCLVFYF